MAKASVAEDGTFYSITGAIKDLNLLDRSGCGAVMEAIAA